MMRQEDKFMYRSIELGNGPPSMMQSQQPQMLFGPGVLPENSVHILELPYVDNELSMLLLMPSSITDDSTGLKKVKMVWVHRGVNCIMSMYAHVRKVQQFECNLNVCLWFQTA